MSVTATDGRVPMKTDILIVGSGCSGLYAALNLPRERKITVISKSDLETNDSYLAQGGMCVLKDESDYSGYFEDTMLIRVRTSARLPTMWAIPTV